MWRRMRRLCELVHRRRWRWTPRPMRQSAIVGDAEHERAFRRLATERGPGAPDRDADLLEQIVALRGVELVQPRNSREGRSVLVQDAIERLVEILGASHDV